MRASYMLGSTVRKTTQHLCVVLYAMYVTLLHKRLEQIGSVLERIVPRGEQGATWEMEYVLCRVHIHLYLSHLILTTTVPLD